MLSFAKWKVLYNIILVLVLVPPSPRTRYGVVRIVFARSETLNLGALWDRLLMCMGVPYASWVPNNRTYVHK